MKIFIEGHTYPTSTVKDYIPSVAFQSTRGGRALINSVGYVYCVERNEAVFLLPKVLLDKKDCLFGKYPAEDCVNDSLLYFKKKELDLVHNLSVYVYRSIQKYDKTHPNNTIVYSVKNQRHYHIGTTTETTLIDSILSLVQFSKSHRFLAVRVAKINKRDSRRVHWNKTIAKEIPAIIGDAPAYISTQNIHKETSYNDTLFSIYYSILAYIKNTFGIDVEIDSRYTIVKGNAFISYLRNIGKAKLLNIRYNYFSDTLLQLWRLCYDFFDKTSRIRLNDSYSEGLIVKDFNIVFESIVDELLCDNISEDRHLKEQYDGKIIDHIFPYKSLFRHGNIYYIVDSKYYKKGTKIGVPSLYKQFTYAKNAITYNVACYNGRPLNSLSPLKYRDDLTEGYDVTPNFFLSATLDFSQDLIESHNVKRRDAIFHILQQFDDRLFDRDTLFILHVEVNFLSILRLYTLCSQSEKELFKSKMREEMRSLFIKFLNDNFLFYKVTIKDTQKDEFLKNAQFLLRGKIIDVSDDALIPRYMVVALSKKQNDGSIQGLLDSYFSVQSFTIS